MNEVTQIIIWWTGAVAVMAILACATFALALALREACNQTWRWALSIMRLSTARYWVDRMERDGLTICMKEYRRMVAERKPRTVDEYNAVEFDEAQGDSEDGHSKGGAA